MSMYPDDQQLEIFGEQVMYPGLDPVTHKFTDGDFSNPLVKPSHIPAASFNLILDNLANLIEAMGMDPNNTDPEQLKKAMQHGFAPRIVGEYHFLAYEPSVAELIRLRLLPLQGQIINIAQYEELCSLKYVGDDENETALWWYKCEEDGTRNIDGLFMRTEDDRGLFFRGAGANSIVRTDMDNPLSPPYDGNSIGSFNPDRDRTYTGSLRLKGSQSPETIISSNGIIAFDNSIVGLSMYGNPATGTIMPTSSMFIQFGNSYEVAGAWLAVGGYVTY